jgi:hypothetical protein
MNHSSGFNLATTKLGSLSAGADPGGSGSGAFLIRTFFRNGADLLDPRSQEFDFQCRILGPPHPPFAVGVITPF